MFKSFEKKYSLRISYSVFLSCALLPSSSSQLLPPLHPHNFSLKRKVRGESHWKHGVLFVLASCSWADMVSVASVVEDSSFPVLAAKPLE